MSWDNPHIVLALGFGAFATGAGSFGEYPAIVIIPSQDGKLHTVGEPMEEAGEVLTEPLPGTIVIAFRDRASIERHRDLLNELIASQGKEQP